MSWILIASFLLPVLVGNLIADGSVEPYQACLPPATNLEEFVSAPLDESKAAAGKKVTLKQTLARLKAHCRKGKLVDGAGKEIRIVHLLGCWGNPPEDYQEQLKQQDEEIGRLQKKYTVIQIPCDQIGDPRRIH